MRVVHRARLAFKSAAATADAAASVSVCAWSHSLRRLSAAAAAAGTAAATTVSVCEHPDARWYRELAEHQALGLTLVEEAKLAVWHEVTRRLRDGGDPNEADQNGVTLLHVAARAGR